MSKFLKARKFQVQKIKPFCIKNIVPKKTKKRNLYLLELLFFLIIWLFDLFIPEGKIFLVVTHINWVIILINCGDPEVQFLKIN
jgi:hypothetical protein